MSFSQWIERAKAGDSEAQYWVGRAYLDGKHDVTERVEIQGEGSDEKTGEKLAITVIRDRRVMLTSFWGPSRIMDEKVEIDRRQGLRWLIKSLKNGYRDARKVLRTIENDPDVQFMLAEMYMKGDIVSYNPRKGMHLLRKAADQDHEKAMQLLAMYFRKNESNRQLHHRLTKESFFTKNSSLKAESFRQACVDGPKAREQYHQFVSRSVFKI